VLPTKKPTQVVPGMGSTSNLPIWVFSEEKIHFERTKLPNARVPIVAFSLETEEDRADEPLSVSQTARFIKSICWSGIFGGQNIAQKFVDDLISVPMMVKSLNTTQFNFTLRAALDAYDAAYAVAGGTLGHETRIKPDKIAKVLKTFHDAVIAECRGAGLTVPPRLRLSLIRPFGTKSFRVMHSYNMEADADDRLIFSDMAGGAPVAFETRCPSFIDLGPPL
jgi:hypothetical protein